MNSSSGGWADYEDHFASADLASQYDQMFENDPGEKLSWKVQRSLLSTVLDRLFLGSESHRALDFACGTGRITELIQTASWDVTGLDASAAMIEQARHRLPTVSFVQGFLDDPSVQESLGAVDNPFQLITAFRFFLNAPAASRSPTLRTLVGMLAADGRLILNNHGSSPSLRNLGLRLRRRRGSTTTRQRDFVKLLTSAGLVIEQRWGAQIFTRRMYRLPLVGWLCCRIEAFLPKLSWGRFMTSRLGADQTYVCRLP